MNLSRKRLTFMVLSPDADTMYFWSKSTTFTAARWPTKTRRKLISVGDCISHTAMDRSCKHPAQLINYLQVYFHVRIIQFSSCSLPGFSQIKNVPEYRNVKRDVSIQQPNNFRFFLPLSKWPLFRLKNVSVAPLHSDVSGCWAFLQF